MSTSTGEGEEVWAGVPGWPHEVSTMGRVRTTAGRVLAQRDTNRPENGPPFYQKADLSANGRRETYLVHRLVLLAHCGPCCEALAKLIAGTGKLGPCPAGHEACHSDDVPDHNWLGNLRWDDKIGNGLDHARQPGYHTPQAQERRAQGAREANARRTLARIHDLLDENKRLRGELAELRNAQSLRGGWWRRVAGNVPWRKRERRQ